jgi:hypothetical protein
MLSSANSGMLSEFSLDPLTSEVNTVNTLPEEDSLLDYIFDGCISMALVRKLNLGHKLTTSFPTSSITNMYSRSELNIRSLLLLFPAQFPK